MEIYAGYVCSCRLKLCRMSERWLFERRLAIKFQELSEKTSCREAGFSAIYPFASSYLWMHRLVLTVSSFHRLRQCAYLECLWLIVHNVCVCVCVSVYRTLAGQWHAAVHSTRMHYIWPNACTRSNVLWPAIISHVRLPANGQCTIRHSP